MVAYPYTLKVLIETEAVFDQSTAEWNAGVAEWETFGKCRDEINGSGAKITTQDSENYVYSAVIYAPKTLNEVPKGAKVQVWNGSELRAEGEVKRYSKDRLHCRIWL